MSKKTLVEFLPETFEQVTEQLKNDEKRWGDTWKHRARLGQKKRVFDRFTDYFDRYRFAGEPIPWLKVIGEAHIALVRENHPEELESDMA